MAQTGEVQIELLEQALGHAGHEVARCDPIRVKPGRTLTAAVTMGSGSAAIARLYAPTEHVGWARHCAALRRLHGGARTPRLLDAGEALEGGTWALETRMVGTNPYYERVEEPPTQSELARSLGSALARLHAATAGTYGSYGDQHVGTSSKLEALVAPRVLARLRRAEHR